VYFRWIPDRIQSPSKRSSSFITNKNKNKNSENKNTNKNSENKNKNKKVSNDRRVHFGVEVNYTDLAKTYEKLQDPAQKKLFREATGYDDNVFENKMAEEKDFPQDSVRYRASGPSDTDIFMGNTTQTLSTRELKLTQKYVKTKAEEQGIRRKKTEARHLYLERVETNKRELYVERNGERDLKQSGLSYLPETHNMAPPTQTLEEWRKNQAKLLRLEAARINKEFEIEQAKQDADYINLCVSKGFVPDDCPPRLKDKCHKAVSAHRRIQRDAEAKARNQANRKVKSGTTYVFVENRNVMGSPIEELETKVEPLNYRLSNKSLNRKPVTESIPDLMNVGPESGWLDVYGIIDRNVARDDSWTGYYEKHIRPMLTFSDEVEEIGDIFLKLGTLLIIARSIDKKYINDRSVRYSLVYQFISNLYIFRGRSFSEKMLTSVIGGELSKLLYYVTESPVVTEAFTEKAEDSFWYFQRMFNSNTCIAIKRIVLGCVGMKLFEKDVAKQIHFVLGREKQFFLGDP